MQNTRSNLRYYIKWLSWILLAQLILANISAAIYAYKFTHFYNDPEQQYVSQNVFTKTWKLFTGPTYYKITKEQQPPFQYETIRLKTSDNIPIDAWYSQTDSSKRCVILFHGISINKSYLDKEAEQFKQWGYTVMLIDFRGHGKSGGNTSTFGVKETDEVQQAFELARAKGNKKIILYGMSLGAAACIKAVSENKVQPDAIIADMPFESLHHFMKHRISTLGFPGEPFSTFITLWLGIERGYNGFSHDVASYAKKVHCPVLVQWGEKDSYIKRPDIEKVYDKLAASKKKLVIYTDANHEFLLHSDPMLWQKEVSGFLTSLN